DAAAVDGGHDRLADSTVAEHGVIGADVEEQRDEVVRRHAVQDDALQGASALGVAGAETGDPVDLTPGQRPQGLARIRVEPEDHALEVRPGTRRSRAVEVLVAAEDDLPEVDVHDPKGPRPDRVDVELLSRELAVRDAAEDVGRKD